MYAKLIDGFLQPAPETVTRNDIVIQNYHLDCNSAMLLADGYKPVEDNQPPADLIRPQKSYLETDTKISTVYTETYTEPNFREKRAAAYPDFREYLDAVVKINSNNEALIAEGNIQLQNYCQYCLEVKALYPKE